MNQAADDTDVDRGREALVWCRGVGSGLLWCVCCHRARLVSLPTRLDETVESNCDAPSIIAVKSAPARVNSARLLLGDWNLNIDFLLPRSRAAIAAVLVINSRHRGDGDDAVWQALACPHQIFVQLSNGQARSTPVVVSLVFTTVQSGPVALPDSHQTSRTTRQEHSTFSHHRGPKRPNEDRFAPKGQNPPVL